MTDFYFFSDRLCEAAEIAKQLASNTDTLKRMAQIIEKVRDNDGRLFICGVGGGAGNGTHAAGDFLKSCHIQAICLTDNVPSLTAITNDEGWNKVFVDTLHTFKLNQKDALLIFSVGGGDTERNVSANLIEAINYAKEVGAAILGVVGKESGYTAQNADAAVVIPMINSEFITTHTESYQSYITHLLVEALRKRGAKWETIDKK